MERVKEWQWKLVGSHDSGMGHEELEFWGETVLYSLQRSCHLMNILVSISIYIYIYIHVCICFEKASSG